MADPQDRPDSETGDAKPPAKKQPAKKATKAAAKKPAAKKTPAKKPAAKKTPAKKAPAKKAAAKSPQPAPPKPADPAMDLRQRVESNGELAAAAKDAAAQAKSTVDGANNPLPRDASDQSAGHSPASLVVAVTLSLLALLLIRQLRRR